MGGAKDFKWNGTWSDPENAVLRYNGNDKWGPTFAARTVISRMKLNPGQTYSPALWFTGQFSAYNDGGWNCYVNPPDGINMRVGFTQYHGSGAVGYPFNFPLVATEPRWNPYEWHTYVWRYDPTVGPWAGYHPDNMSLFVDGIDCEPYKQGGGFAGDRTSSQSLANGDIVCGGHTVNTTQLHRYGCPRQDTWCWMKTLSDDDCLALSAGRLNPEDISTYGTDYFYIDFDTRKLMPENQADKYNRPDLIKTISDAPRSSRTAPKTEEELILTEIVAATLQDQVEATGQSVRSMIYLNMMRGN